MTGKKTESSLIEGYVQDHKNLLERLGDSYDFDTRYNNTVFHLDYDLRRTRGQIQKKHKELSKLEREIEKLCRQEDKLYHKLKTLEDNKEMIKRRVNETN